MAGFVFDLRTAYLIACLLYLILPIVTWAVSRPYKSSGISLWCGGSLMFGVGWLLLTVLRGSVSDILSYPIANLLVFLSFMLRAQSLLFSFEGNWQWKAPLVISLGFVVVFEILREIDSVGSVRVAFASLGIMCALLMFTGTACRLGWQHSSPAALCIGVVYGLAGLASLWRLGNAIRGAIGHIPLTPEANNSALLSNNPDISLLSIAMTLAAVVGHIGFLGIVLESAARRRIESAKELAREGERGRLAIQLAQFDRQSGIAELSSSLAHELTQPLTAILSNSQTAKRGMLANRLEASQAIELLSRIEINSRRANEIVKRIRSFIRPQTVARIAINLTVVIHEAVSLINQKATLCNVGIAINVPTEPALICGDSIQLSQVIINLLRNAIDALNEDCHNQHKKITISVTANKDTAIIGIRDNGPGLSNDALSLACTPFFSTKKDGMGMGLVISRAIIVQHSGSMTFCNSNEGGAVFTILLPLLNTQPE